MNCNKMEDQLIDYLLNILNHEDRGKLDSHLGSCLKCQQKLESFKKAWILLEKWKPFISPSDLRQIKQEVMDNIRAQNLIEEKSSKESFISTIESEKRKAQIGRQKTSKVLIWKTIINNKIIASATAAAIVIGILLGVNFINKLSVPGVVWGQLVERIENIDFYTYRTRSISLDIHGTFVGQQTSHFYVWKDGFRMDRHFPWINYDIIQYTSWLDKTFISVHPEIKKYTRTLLTDEYINRMHFREDPRLSIKMFMSYNYTKLGRKIVDGQEAEGIEINDPKFGKFGFEGCIAQIWVNVDTNLPVLLELEGTSGHGIVETKVISENFKWNGEYDESIVEPDLSEYSLVAEVESIPVNEESVVLALHKFSELVNGKYPSSLANSSATVEIIMTYLKIHKEKMGTGFLFWQEEDFDWEGYTALHSLLNTTCTFYAELFNTDKEIVYHGEKVTADDSDLPLMRWKITDDKYRVLFGDLSVEDVSEEQLTELEEALNR